jgi:3,4-dihydroxy 2-butanone 4-phosphate synthase/GTP cyclohydrolase II
MSVKLVNKSEPNHGRELDPIEDIIADIRQGRMVIIMDDEDRENEGDFIMAATHCSAEHVNFMARYGRGLICLTLTQERCAQLNLPLMVSDTHYRHATNFTVSIEAAQGVTTGISAADRAKTIQAAVAADAKPSDLVQPGHVFPLMAQPGGVLNRAGHTEAGCDLARIAGLEPAAVIVEILNEDGSMARRPQLEAISAQHGLKIGTIADLIRYRIHNEKTVHRVAESELATRYGGFRCVAFKDSIEGQVHFALVNGEFGPDTPVTVRVHVMNPLFDLTQAVRPDSDWPILEVLKRAAAEPASVVVILCNQLQPDELIQQLGSLDRERAGESQPPTRINELRNIGLGGQILSELGVHKMRLMSRPRRIHALSGFDLEVVEYLGE